MSEQDQDVANELFNIVQEYSKRHGLSYVLGVGKMQPNNKFFVGDIFHQERNNDIFYICQCLIKHESIGAALAAAILQDAKNFKRCVETASKDIH